MARFLRKKAFENQIRLRTPTSLTMAPAGGGRAKFAEEARLDQFGLLAPGHESVPDVDRVPDLIRDMKNVNPLLG